MSSREVDDSLAGLPAEKQVRMRELRTWIKAAPPEADEVITYKMPGFKQDGKFLVSYDAFKSHYSIFPGSEGVHKAMGTDIEPFLTGKGTIGFTNEKPLTESQVMQIIKARIAELARESG